MIAFRRILSLLLLTIMVFSCSDKKEKSTATKEEVKTSFTWDNVNMYFLMTDRFYNGDKTNDFTHPEDAPPAPYRGFMGGDIAGVTYMIRDGYFNDLGVSAIWTTPVLENIIGSVDEGTGTSYGFHGYWTKDWTAFDSRVTTEEQFAQFVKEAHNKGIRIVMDAIVNHTGPVTPQDKVWPADWVRTGPQCEYKDYASTVICTLVKNLPDILTDSDQEVEVPDFLLAKWKNEGRLDEELAQLDAFFTRTGYKRTPANYIIKWLTDYVRKYGIDGFRVDTAKHTEAEIWKRLKEQAIYAFQQWKKEHPQEALDDTEFYMVGEVYNYYPTQGRAYDYGDRKVDFYDYGYDALINFDFKSDANKDFEALFTKYDALMNDTIVDGSIVNYIASHDDGSPFDIERARNFEAATKLMLTPGGAQIYYGDETSRPLNVEADGDAKLRSFMNWDDHTIDSIAMLKSHWMKLGQFRHDHPSVGAGSHKKIADAPYTFSRSWKGDGDEDSVVVALTNPGTHAISVSKIFEDGDQLTDAYSGQEVTVSNGSVELESASGIILLEKSI